MGILGTGFGNASGTGCGCCTPSGCPTTVCVAGCDNASVGAGYSVELWDFAGTTKLDTQTTGSDGCVTFSITPDTVYTLKIPARNGYAAYSGQPILPCY